MMLVSSVMLKLDRFPVLKRDTIVKACLDEMSRYCLGIACIVDENGLLLGIFTDGDLRRRLLKSQKPLASFFVDDVLDHGTQTPLMIKDTDSLASAIALMEQYQVWDLPVVDRSSYLVGLLHLHPAVKALMPSHNS